MTHKSAIKWAAFQISKLKQQKLSNMKVIAGIALFLTTIIGSSLAAPKHLKELEEPPYTVVQSFEEVILIIMKDLR